MLLPILWGCSIGGGTGNTHFSKMTGTGADLRAMVAGLSPEGWELYGDVLQYNANNLYRQINGRAELYLSYDVVSLTCANFENSADHEQFIELSIYDMGTTTNAFGVFSVERSPGSPLVRLGRLGYRSGGNYYIWKGQYYIALVSSGAPDECQRLGFEMVREAVNGLDDSGEAVWGRVTLPQQKRVPESVRYFKVDAMGLDFMRNTYTAQYQHCAGVVNAFLSQQGSVESAESTIAQYVQFADQYGNGSECLTVDGATFVLCNMGVVFDVIFQKGPLAGGVTAVQDRDFAIRAAMELWSGLPDE